MATRTRWSPASSIRSIPEPTGAPSTSAAAWTESGTTASRRDTGTGAGSFSYDASLSAVHDDESGSGFSSSLRGGYSHDRTYANLRYSETSKDYLPRLGYAPQTDYRGFSSYAEQSWAPAHGRFLDYSVGGYAEYKKSYDLSKPFHEEAGIFPSATLRGGFGFGANLDWSRYFGETGDQTYGFNLRRGVGDPYRNVGLSYESGTRGGQGYRNLSLGAAYRPLPTLQLNLNYQSTSYLGVSQDQTILSANYDLDQYHSVGGRIVTGPNVSNFFVSLRQAGNRGAEYYLILGDPNAPHFRTSLILKAVFPLSTKF